MVSEIWYSKIESTILTILEYELVQKLTAPYPNMNCTTSNQAESLENVSDFPTMYIHMLPPPERGQDLTNETVNAINCTIELQVFSDKSETECRNIITSGIQQLKKLHFNIPTFPDPQSIDKKYVAIARGNRIVANGDRELVPEEDD